MNMKEYKIADVTFSSPFNRASSDLYERSNWLNDAHYALATAPHTTARARMMGYLEDAIEETLRMREALHTPEELNVWEYDY